MAAVQITGNGIRLDLHSTVYVWEAGKDGSNKLPPLKGLWDTGAENCAISKNIFDKYFDKYLQTVRRQNFRKRPTPDGHVDAFDIGLEVQIEGLLPISRWVSVLPLPEEDFLIGMDVISMGRMVINDKRSFFFE